jgi:excisionase family DNA binding protein
VEIPPSGQNDDLAEPLVVTVAQAARLLGISERQVFYELRAGRIRSFTIGRRRLIPVTAVNDYIMERVAEQSDRI